MLRDQLSAVLRDELLAEVEKLCDGDQAAGRGQRALAANNTLSDADARQVEQAFAAKLASFAAGGLKPGEADVCSGFG
jgi:hypothetical protein